MKPGETDLERTDELEELIPEGTGVVGPRLEQSQADDDPDGGLEDEDVEESEDDRSGEP